MRLVIVETPNAGDGGRNDYARAALADCLARGESPILNDRVAVLPWYTVAHAAVFYLDKGFSAGMGSAWRHLQAAHPDLPSEWRFLAPAMTSPERMAYAFWFRWEVAFAATTADQHTCATPLGRLEVDRATRPPTPAAPFRVALNGRLAAFYATREAAKTGAEHLFRWLAARRGVTPW